MNVRVISSNGSVWHKNKTFNYGDVIEGLDERIANRLIKSGDCVAEVDDEVVAEPEPIQLIVDADTGEIVSEEVAKRSTYEYDTQELVSSDEELNAELQDETTVDNAVSSILEAVTTKPKRGRPRK